MPFKGTLKELKHQDKEVNVLIESDDKLKTLYNIVNLIEGNKRHTSIHAAGIVISREKLDEVVPIKETDEINLTEYTIDYLEELGLLKMDFLALRNLTIIQNVLELIEKEKGIDIGDTLIVDPAKSEKIDEYANILYELRKAKGMTEEQAKQLVLDPVYYGMMMVKQNEAYGLVSKYKDYSRGLYLCSSHNEDGARKTSAEFLATMVRCCGDYWQDIFVAGTVIP